MLRLHTCYHLEHLDLSKFIKLNKFISKERKLIMDGNTSFHNLKQSIIPLVNTLSNLEILKTVFEKEIASKRELAQIKTFSQMLEVLEERDCFNETNISSLLIIADVLQIEEIKNLAKTYKKLQDLGDQSCCSKCSAQNELQLISVAKQKCTDSTLNNSSEIENKSEYDLQDVVKNISRRIGEQWRILLRELDVPEKNINDIRKIYRNNVILQAEHALKLWIKIKGSEATKAKLEEALNNRLCKQKGLGSHLMMPTVELSVC